MKYIHTLKYAAVILLAAFYLQACQSSVNKDNKSQTVQAPKTDIDHEHEHQAATDLSLNNGTKWQADSSTNKNVSALSNIVEQTKPASPEDYHQTGKNLQEGINKMVSECRMKGPDHTALHHWLEPLMEENKKLLEVTTTEEGEKSFEMIQKQIEKYNDYFE